VQHVDRRPQTGPGRVERRAVECGAYLVDIGLAQEAQGDVPVVLGHEAHTALVLAVQLAQLLAHLFRWPQGHEEPRHAPHVTR